MQTKSKDLQLNEVHTKPLNTIEKQISKMEDISKDVEIINFKSLDSHSSFFKNSVDLRRSTLINEANQILCQSTSIGK